MFFSALVEIGFGYYPARKAACLDPIEALRSESFELGIGRTTCIALAQAGCDVIVNFLHSHDRAEEVVRQVQALRRRSLALQADVLSETSVATLVDRSKTAFDGIDILIDNAVIIHSEPIKELTSADWYRVVNQNLTSAFLVSQAALPGMRQEV